jgi:N-carbamoyl-L-amino-acid hydrolase
MRHPDDAVLAQMEAELHRVLPDIALPLQLDFKIERVWDSPAVKFDPACIEAVREAAAAAGEPAREIVSGAGHDAAYIARVAPTSMIFVPCENGLSHNELEKSEPEQVIAGANVLLRAVLQMDAQTARG